MPELPEVTHLARQIDKHLTGRTISAVEILQPKCLNISMEAFTAGLLGATIQGADNRGKWIRVRTDQGWLLISLGMGGEILLVTRQTLPEKRRLVFDFSDGVSLSINFWWFGYAHYAPLDGLESHEMTSKLGPNALDLSLEDLAALFKGQRARLKAFLLDQSRIAGIGNAYIHDILYLARLHPQRKIESLEQTDIARLHQAIRDGLQPSLDKGGAFYEVDLFGNKGGFLMEDIRIGYREGQPCPTCSTPILKIKTGGTSSFICPSCQPEK